MMSKAMKGGEAERRARPVNGAELAWLGVSYVGYEPDTFVSDVAAITRSSSHTRK